MVQGIKRHMGVVLMITGSLHTAIGILIYTQELQLIVANGWWNTVGDKTVAAAAFWFMITGFLLILLGHTADWLMKKQGIAPPATFGWTLLLVSLAGAIAMPVSGFWFVLPQAWILLRK